MAKGSLPPGFRFHPTDAELVLYYLKRKVIGKRPCLDAITEIDLYDYAPWDLPDKSCLKSKDLEWFFLCPREKKYPNHSRAKRSTSVGYWKATGKDRSIYYNNCIVGMKRSLVFHLGRPPKGNRTNWVMYEYRLDDKELQLSAQQDQYVICKVFQKSGLGPKIGEQYGAPFNEEEWEDDSKMPNLSAPPLVPCRPSDATSSSMLNQQHQNSVGSDSFGPLGTLARAACEQIESSAGVKMPPCARDVPDDIPDDAILLEQISSILTDPSSRFDNLIGLPGISALYESGSSELIADCASILKEMDVPILDGQDSKSQRNAFSGNKYIYHPVIYELRYGNYIEVNDFYWRCSDALDEMVLSNDAPT